MQKTNSLIKIDNIEVSSSTENLKQVAKIAEELTKKFNRYSLIRSRHFEDYKEDGIVAEIRETLGYSLSEDTEGKDILELARRNEFDNQRLLDLLRKADDFGIWTIDIDLKIIIDIQDKKIKSQVDINLNELKKEIKGILFETKKGYIVKGYVLVVVIGNNVPDDIYYTIKDQFERAVTEDYEVITGCLRLDRPTRYARIQILSVGEADKYRLEYDG